MRTLQEKIGAMMMVGFDGTSPPAHILDWLARGRIGGIYLFARNVESPGQVKRLIDSCRAAANSPILVGIDQEGGIVARLRSGFSQSPGAMAVGAARDPQLAEDIAFMLGRELAALGINWNFAPVADIAHQPDNPSVSTRSVGADSQLVSQIVCAQIRGFQGAGVAATVKHFPGLGNTVIDTHDALARVSGSLDYLYEQDLAPFQAAMEAGVACVMLTHVLYEALDERHPATLSPRIVSGLLRRELGYAGAVCTDCMEMKAISDGFGPGEAAVLAVEAGVDMPLYSHTRANQEAAYNAILAAVETGRIAEARIDQSVARIDKLKAAFALRDQPELDIVNCAEHQALSLNAARAGTVMLKRGAALPLGERNKSLAVIEFAATRISDAVDGGADSSFANLLRGRLEPASYHLLDPAAPDASAIELALRRAEIILLLTRNAHMRAEQLKLAKRVIASGKPVILLCALNPYDAGVLGAADSIICTNGDSRPSLQAAVEALCGDFQPTGQLSVALA